MKEVRLCKPFLTWTTFEIVQLLTDHHSPSDLAKIQILNNILNYTECMIDGEIDMWGVLEGQKGASEDLCNLLGINCSC